MRLPSNPWQCKHAMNTLRKNAFPPCETQDFASLLLLAADVMLELTLSANAARRIFNEIRSLSDRHQYEIWIRYNDSFGTG